LNNLPKKLERKVNLSQHNTRPNIVIPNIIHSAFLTAASYWRRNSIMTEGIDRAVNEILREISARRGASGVSFQQSPTGTARYPTEAILTVVRMLAEEAESAGDSAMAGGLRTMLEQCDPNLPIEIEFAGAGHLAYISEPHGRARLLVAMGPAK
jgi:hypothetical protein